MAKRSSVRARDSIDLTLRAQNDLSDIHEHIAREHPLNADRFLLKLIKVIDGLATMPRRHPRAPESVSTGGDVRHAIHGSYRVVFEVVDNRVIIHTVRHAARRPAADLD